MISSLLVIGSSVPKFTYSLGEGKGKKLPRIQSWPSLGALEMIKVVLKYPNSKDAALKGLSIKVSGGEHIAIVGRTGSGKTSIFNALLGMVEDVSGTIRIDDVDINTIDISTIRRKDFKRLVAHIN